MNDYFSLTLNTSLLTVLTAQKKKKKGSLFHNGEGLKITGGESLASNLPRDLIFRKVKREKKSNLLACRASTGGYSIVTQIVNGSAYCSA